MEESWNKSLKLQKCQCTFKVEFPCTIFPLSHYSEGLSLGLKKNARERALIVIRASIIPTLLLGTPLDWPTPATFDTSCAKLRGEAWNAFSCLKFPRARSDSHGKPRRSPQTFLPNRLLHCTVALNQLNYIDLFRCDTLSIVTPHICTQWEHVARDFYPLGIRDIYLRE